MILALLIHLISNTALRIAFLSLTQKCHEQARRQDFLREGAIQRVSRRTKRAPEALASRGICVTKCLSILWSIHSSNNPKCGGMRAREILKIRTDGDSFPYTKALISRNSHVSRIVTQTSSDWFCSSLWCALLPYELVDFRNQNGVAFPFDHRSGSVSTLLEQYKFSQRATETFFIVECKIWKCWLVVGKMIARR